MKKMYLKLGLVLLISGMVSNSYGKKAKKDNKSKISEMKELKKADGVKLTEVTYQLKVDATLEYVWAVIAQYGNIASFHSGVAESGKVGKSSNEVSMGCERSCTIYDGKRKIDIKERVTEIEKGKYYRYEVYEWVNFPLKKMFNGFGVKKDAEGNTILYQVQNYRLKPGFLTGMMKGKLKKGARETLIMYKHYIETGEKKADKEKILKMEKYKNV